MQETFSRKTLLDKKSFSFQKMPSGIDGFGRIRSIKDLSLSIDGKSFVLDDMTKLCSSQEEIVLQSVFLKELLYPGDCVALKLKDSKVQSIWLLTPNMSQQPQQKNQLMYEWFGFKSQLREFFQKRGFYEVQTPTLVKNPGTEPYLDLFSTTEIKGGVSKKWYLPTSPEIGLKKLLLQDYRNLFEMRPCFRNNEDSDHHLSEFWMLEWYRTFATLMTIEYDIKEMLRHFAPSVTLEIKTMAQIFKDHLGFNLSPATSYEELQKLAKELNLHIDGIDNWNDLFHLIFVDKLEPKVSKGPIIIKNYPPSLCAYARVSDEGWAERFEFYWNGLEIANAFEELTDPEEQLKRFMSDLSLKQKLGKEIPELDEEFLQTMQRGLPPTGGIAMGMERFFMAWKGLKTIRFY